jgi:hypothetical protein
MITPRRREANGRRARYRPEDPVAAAAKQPHRRGERTTVGATPWQRAIAAGRIADPSRHGLTPGELEAIGLYFAECRANYLKAIGAPNGYAIDSGGNGRDLSPALRKRWRLAWAEIAFVLTERDRRLLIALQRATDAHPDAEERLWGGEFLWAVREALVTLGRHFR